MTAITVTLPVEQYNGLVSAAKDSNERVAATLDDVVKRLEQMPESRSGPFGSLLGALRQIANSYRADAKSATIVAVKE